MNQTYNPILESVPLRRIRTRAPHGAAIGTEVVLERKSGAPLVLQAGERVPAARLGDYRTLHRVDVANRAIGYALTVPSRDASFPFTVKVTLGCQITDSVMVVRDGITDMAAGLQPWITALIRSVTMRHDVMFPSDAEAEVLAELRVAYPPDGVRVSGFAVSVEARNTAELISAHQERRVLEVRRATMMPVASGGREAMLAHIMAVNDGDPTPLLDREQEERENATKASLVALSALMGSNKLEEFNTARISEKVMGEFFPGGEPLHGGKRPGIRDRIEYKRKSIDAGLGIDPVRVEDDSALDSATDERAASDRTASARSSDGKRSGGAVDGVARDAGAPGVQGRPSRVRGVLRAEGS